jgi:tyrosine-protein kinase Etk/Wzc
MGLLLGRMREASLRTDLEQLALRIGAMADSRAVRTVCLAGVAAGAGTTTLSVWLATALARAGRKVLLIEANRTRPSIAKLFRLPRAPGVAEVLAGEVALAEAVVAVDGNGMGALGCGAPGSDLVPHPPARWRSLLTAAHATYEVILVDAGSADRPAALAVAAAAQTTVLVVEADRSMVETVAAAAERLEGHGARLLGIILNKRRKRPLEVLDGTT